MIISDQETGVEVTASKFARNVSRFMQNALTSLEKFNYIFKAGGFPLNNMLERIFHDINPTKDILGLIQSDSIDWETGVDTLYKTLKG